MANVRAIVAAVGLSIAMAAGAKPPLQLADQGIRLEPLAVAPAWIENGKVVLGDWQPYAPAPTRGDKGLYYAFDCVGGYIDGVASRSSYVNFAHGGRGAAPGDLRSFATEGCPTGPWSFGASYVNPTVAEDMESLGCGVSPGFPIDSVDFSWYWGGGSCVISFFTSDDPAGCDDGDPLSHMYLGGVAIGFGSVPPGGFYFLSADGLYSQYGITVPLPAPGGSYLATLTTDGSTPAMGVGTQFALWGTGDASNEPYRAGRQDGWAWDDDNPTDGAFDTNQECYDYWHAVCPEPLGKMVGFLIQKCAADINADGFVNADDYDLFAENFDAANLCADLNGDGFVNGNDYDAFATWFDEGC
ncbi:MAG: hypothetical protein JNL50_07495 [Phycisphaerae bacterium]|nr:hypothetical protein [Phycisphaerae bacterium]